jgi:hypothetical protein
MWKNDIMVKEHGQTHQRKGHVELCLVDKNEELKRTFRS